MPDADVWALIARLTPDVVSAVGAASTWTGSESENAALYEAQEVVRALAALTRPAPVAAPRGTEGRDDARPEGAAQDCGKPGCLHDGVGPYSDCDD